MNACIAYPFFSYHELDCVPRAEPPACNTHYRGQCRIQCIWNTWSFLHSHIACKTFWNAFYPFYGCLSTKKKCILLIYLVNSFKVRHLLWFHYFPFEWNIIDWVKNFWALVYSLAMIKSFVCSCLMKKYEALV